MFLDDSSHPADHKTLPTFENPYRKTYFRAIFVSKQGHWVHRWLILFLKKKSCWVSKLSSFGPLLCIYILGILFIKINKVAKDSGNLGPFTWRHQLINILFNSRKSGNRDNPIKLPLVWKLFERGIQITNFKLDAV